MGLFADMLGPLVARFGDTSLVLLVAGGFSSLIVVTVLLNVLSQLLLKDRSAPPVVFHYFPVIGSTVTYGIDPYKFFEINRRKYGDCFTFILLGRKTTVFVGPKGNDFILNGKLKDVCAEEIYRDLCTPVFGAGVVYDCPNSKLMEQKKFVKFGLTTEAFRSYVKLITAEVEDFVKRSPRFKGNQGVIDAPVTFAELTIFTASRSLQGKEVRDRFDASFADLYHDLDMGFSAINFALPWAPFPHNRKRDVAHKKMVATYSEIIAKRRSSGNENEERDMIWNLMGCKYKNGITVPDEEIAHMMIAILMAGQHSSSSTVSWIFLRLATRPHITEELLQEQIDVLGADLPPLEYEDIAKLPFHTQVIKETLRLHSPIHSIMRKVKSPMPVDGTPWVIPTSHVLLSSPGVSSRDSEYFPNPLEWDPHRWDTDSAGTHIPDAADDEEKFDYGYGMVTKGAASPYLPFGAGRHRCIGEQFAYIQIGTIMAAMVREFKFRGVDGSKVVPNTDYSSLFSQPLRPAKIVWERRGKAMMNGAE